MPHIRRKQAFSIYPKTYSAGPLSFMRFWCIIEITMDGRGSSQNQHKPVGTERLGHTLSWGHRTLPGVYPQQKARVGRYGHLLTFVRTLLLLTFLAPAISSHAQSAVSDLDAQVEALLASMSVEERVGQVFLVTFVGSNPSPGSDIAQLIRQEHVGGVVLLAANSNFVNSPETPRQVAELTNTLQAMAMESTARVPLFVAVDHEGDGYPYTRITGGTTRLPNAMAIGATWRPDNAKDVGQITGLELAAMGVNLLLGPVVDVLNNPRPSGQGDIGTRTFGGDAWWVGEMGRAYIEGVHQGSGGRVATVAKHFPGHGGSDRLPDEEVATVDKSLEQLTRIELAPFFAVTGAGDDGMTDAFMSSHIRYRGIQGDVRQYTAPISFDPEGMGAILALEPFAYWRLQRLIVSDSLGVPAVRKYFDPTLGTFPHRRIAKEAFLAGNDLLLLSQFDLGNVWADQFRNIRDTIAFFRDEYQTNPSFASRVDEAVSKILRLKLALYPEFAPEAVRVHPSAALQVCGLGTEVTQRIASQALTLLYPDANALPPAPRQGEKIVIFTDARTVRECYTEQCQPFVSLSQTAVQDAIVRFYGPSSTGQVSADDITSLSFGQLVKFLNGEKSDIEIGSLLETADWLVFAQQDLNSIKGPNSDAVKQFLNLGLSTSYHARNVVFAFNAPYYLDTTEISKLDLYLAAYSKTQPFVEAAVRALFGELMPRGSSPVDVAGINYDLQQQLAADPEKALPLTIVEPVDSTNAKAPANARLFAGPILDHNGRPVPDGTQVTFFAEYADGDAAPPHAAFTDKGMAETTFALTRPGQVQFRVESGNAHRSQTQSLVVLAAPTATPMPSRTPLPSATLSPMKTPLASPTTLPTATPVATEMVTAIDPDRPVDGVDLALSAGTIATISVLASLVWAGTRRQEVFRIRGLLLMIIGGSTGYILYALALTRPEAWGVLPNAVWIGRAAVIAITAIGAILLATVLALIIDRPNRRVGP